jgi:hypothetical protein
MKKNILAGIILLVSLNFAIRAQTRNQDCYPLSIPAACERLVGPIDELNRRISNLQERLRHASPATKAALLRNINQLVTQRDAAQGELARCRREHGALPRQLAPDELTARFTGTASLQTTNSNAAGPFDVALDLNLRFSRDRCTVTITRFPKLKIRTKDLPLVGKILVEVTKTGGGMGIFHPVSGNLTLPITLHLHYDTPLITDDDATFSLTTGRSISPDRNYSIVGSPLDGGGGIVLVGTTTFRHGYLSGSEGSLGITANISPRP